ncbi:MAG: 30S ribosomal protein S6 [Clostridia bacterium]|nr:30S ribosomal protein S6 [Clostridia bacterium]MBR2735604.1 30S ribosomal protein S6 [Clostridia bacterium]
MAEIKNAYEFMLIVSVKLGEKTEELVNKFKDMISEKAELTNMDSWGKRKLAYMINKESEADYTVFDFNSDSEFPKELDRICQITDGVLRSMIVKKS